MARPKLDKTLADYMAIAITPALIMLLTGSLVWFLAELGYDGGRPQRIRWILFWFVIGAVLVARIAIENGRAHAAMFLAGLAGATSLTIFKFAPDAPLVPIICLGIVAWCADKLTWDCTLIDESEDASGEGLLQVAGVADEAELKDDNTAAPSTDSEAESDGRADKKKVPFWKRLFTNESERAGKPHAPGLWVVYFSLAALPLYGFGQLWIPASDETSRHFAFQCLLVYVGAALGLLLMTSFLGLRRYLRQRNIEMPTAMAATWVGMGSAIAIGILVFAMLLPRPQGDYSIAEAIDYVSEEVQEASDWAFLDDDGGEGEGQLSGPADADAEKGSATDPDQQGQPGGEKAGNQVAQNDQDNAEDGEGGKEQGEGENGQGSGDKQGEGEQEGEKNDGEQTAQNGEQGSKSEASQDDQQASSDGQKQDGQQAAQNEDSGDKQQSDSGDSSEEPSGEQMAQNAPEPSPDEVGEESSGEEESTETEEAESSDTSTAESDSSWMDTIAENMGTLFKWLVYAALAAGVIYMAIKNWPAVARFLQNLWAEMLGMFGRKPTATVAGSEETSDEPIAPPRPFSTFSDPFRSGKAAQSSPGELVRYTFEALQAWAFENNCGRTPDQTPMEFGQRLQSQRLKISSEAHEVSLLYAQVAYGGHRPDDSSVATLQKLWRKLT